MGQWGVLSPELDPCVGLRGRGALMVSADEVGVSSGMLAADRARWSEVAEGVLETVPALLALLLVLRLGLTSVLLLRERKAGLVFMPAAVAVAAGVTLGWSSWGSVSRRQW